MSSLLFGGFDCKPHYEFRGVYAVLYEQLCKEDCRSQGVGVGCVAKRGEALPLPLPSPSPPRDHPDLCFRTSILFIPYEQKNAMAQIDDECPPLKTELFFCIKNWGHLLLQNRTILYCQIVVNVPCPLSGSPCPQLVNVELRLLPQAIAPVPLFAASNHRGS